MDNLFYLNLAKDTKKLLEEKGFRGAISIDQIFSRIYSEVGELINAYKKGLPKDVQAEELADIVIYLFNVVDKYELYKLEDETKNRRLLGNKKYIDIYALSSIDDEIHGKNTWKMFNTIIKYVNQIDISVTHLERHKDSYPDKELWKTVLTNLVDEVNRVLYICGKCAERLDIDLEAAIKEKMAKNWKRPYRYNTAPEHFSKE